jgi:RNA polymerase sigma factor FliA
MNIEKNYNLKYKDLWEAYWKDPDSIDNVSALIEAWMPLVHSILHKIRIQIPPYIPVEDLFQAGSLALFKAIELFDPDYKVAFKSFAYTKIRGAVIDELRNNDHLSRSDRTKVKKIQNAIREWISKNGTTPDESELADAVAIKQTEIASLLAKSPQLLSLDQSVNTDEEGKEVALGDVLADKTQVSPVDAAQEEDIRALLRKAFRKLKNREQKILYLYYFEDLRLSEVAVLFDLTEARICQIHALAIIKLRTIINSLKNNELAGN